MRRPKRFGLGLCSMLCSWFACAVGAQTTHIWCALGIIICFSLCPALQPTLQSFEKAAPEFVSMALLYLDKTISEWKALEAAGFKM